jgi:peptidoglycan hydrolase CwlO-like protein
MKKLNSIGISVTLIFVIAELSYINAKSLLYIVDSFGYIDRVFSIIGSLAFSMVTILVMRTSQSKWMKVVFPLFDSLMVFCGFNLKFADNLTGNPIALGLTVFMALFTGLIMFSLGSINKTEINSHQTDNNSHQTEINSLQTQLQKKESEYISLEGQYKKLTTEYSKIQSEIISLETDFEKYKTVFVNAERSRILKKKPENRTIDEVQLLENN